MDRHRHFTLHKPFGYLSQFIYNQDNQKKKLLGELHDFPKGTMCIGRLDKESEGLLLLTTDGKESYAICSRKVEKEYYVLIDGILTEEKRKLLEKGVEISIEGQLYHTLPCRVRILESVPDFPERIKKVRDDRHGPSSWISVVISEGKYRQVRKMTAVVGYPTLRLVRVRIGNMRIQDLQAGKVEEVVKFDY